MKTILAIMLLLSSAAAGAQVTGAQTSGPQTTGGAPAPLPGWDQPTTAAPAPQPDVTQPMLGARVGSSVTRRLVTRLGGGDNMPSPEAGTIDRRGWLTHDPRDAFDKDLLSREPQ